MNENSNVIPGNCLVLFELRGRNVVTSIILATEVDNPSGTSVTTYKSTLCHSSQDLKPSMNSKVSSNNQQLQQPTSVLSVSKLLT